jgi:hypothetical protein
MKAYGVPGFTNRKELDIIYEWAKTVPENGTIVEIGSLFGRTAVAFAEGAHPSVNIYAIDFFDGTWDNLYANSKTDPIGFWEKGKLYNKGDEFKKFTTEHKNIIPLTLGNDEQVYEYNLEPIDVLFIDASHTNPNDLDNILYFKKFLKKNSLICGHDYNKLMYPDIVQNVQLLEETYNTTAIFYKGSSMWAIRIKE